MSELKRIQRQRTKGWRMPEGVVYVGRPTRWGNPFTVGKTIRWHADADVRLWQWGDLDGIPDEWVMTREQAVRSYAKWLRCAVGRSGWAMAVDTFELTGHNLACWCPLDVPCHADVLLHLANEPWDWGRWE